MFRTAKITTTIAASAVVLGLALTGCSGQSSTTKAADAPKSAPAAASAKPTPKAEVTPKFGKTVSYEDLDVAITAPVAYVPSEYASTGSAPNNVKFTITLTNTGTKAYDPSLFSTTVSSAGSEGDQIFDSEKNIMGSPDTSILPGKSITFDEAYNVSSATDLQMDVRPGFDYKTSTWTN